MAQSAFANDTAGAGFLARLGDGLTRGLTFLAENNPRYARIQQLNRISDAELEAQGTTRAEAVRHMFRDQFYL
ncbi:DUF1127 domain-containing protein [Roseivivax sediminis]|uniref:DUF1127 domain-containing protein n=1 Tax=Roseivivax sediminis TaxID=936889 RepID=A0A1I1WBK9_9RHOB|nr:DUF1127 domain-containing protein [Roseivivax sediminis]SFD90440.1 hypothetical protein SAMN04515678_104146 [Roseivivax sediminis]